MIEIERDRLVFIIDLNEVTGDELPVSLDFTANYGAFVNRGQEMPAVHSTVLLHSDDDDTLYYGTVVKVVDTRDFIARIDWDSGTPVLNQEWSAQCRPIPVAEGAQVSACPKCLKARGVR